MEKEQANVITNFLQAPKHTMKHHNKNIEEPI